MSILEQTWLPIPKNNERCNFFAILQSKKRNLYEREMLIKIKPIPEYSWEASILFSTYDSIHTCRVTNTHLYKSTTCVKMWGNTKKNGGKRYTIYYEIMELFHKLISQICCLLCQFKVIFYLFVPEELCEFMLRKVIEK